MAGQQRDDDHAGDREESDKTVAMSATALRGTKVSPGLPESAFFRRRSCSERHVAARWCDPVPLPRSTGSPTSSYASDRRAVTSRYSQSMAPSARCCEARSARASSRAATRSGSSEMKRYVAMVGP